MPKEFIIKNGFISNSGSTVFGTINVENIKITGITTSTDTEYLTIDGSGNVKKRTITGAGDSGISGLSGTGGSGISGLQSTSGISGISGTSGLSGVSGVSGISGRSGISGLSGTGTSGISGLQSTSGISGLQATSGISGLSGTSGLSGVSGISGRSGISGLSGAGTSGISGLGGDGVSGISGLDGAGTSGISGLGGDGVSGISGLAPTGQIILTSAGSWPSITSGAGSPLQTETTTNDVNFYYTQFVDSSITYTNWAIAMPSDYNGGTVTATFYWITSSSSTNSVVWGIQGRSYGDNEALDQAFGTAQTVTDANNGTDTLNITAATSAVTLAGTPAAGEYVQFRVYREGNAGGDTLAAIAELIQVRITYTRA